MVGVSVAPTCIQGSRTRNILAVCSCFHCCVNAPTFEMPNDEDVCHCRAVTNADVIQAIRNHKDRRSCPCAANGSSLCGSVIEDLGAASICGTCKPAILSSIGHSISPPLQSTSESHACRSITAKVEILECGEGPKEGDLDVPEPDHSLYKYPIVSHLARLYNIIIRPIETFCDWDQRYDSVFTYNVPLQFKLTFIPPECYEKMYRLPSSVVQIGPVYGNIPSAGMWFPRNDEAAEHAGEVLQDLVVSGRRLCAEILRKHRCMHTFSNYCAEAIAELLAERDHLVLFQDISTSIRRVLFKAILLEDAETLFQAGICEAFEDMSTDIDIVRATLANLPIIGKRIREFDGTQRVHAILNTFLNSEQGHASSFGAIVRKASANHPDAVWLAYFVLWNAAVYTPTYAARTVYEILYRHDNQRSIPSRRQVSNYFLETIRMYPVGSVTRHLLKPIRFRQGNNWYYVPAGNFVAALPYARCHAYGNDFDPNRWESSDVPRPHLLFGSGTYGCPASQHAMTCVIEYVSTLLSTAKLTLPSGHEYIPAVCRIHLLREEKSVVVRVDRG